MILRIELKNVMNKLLALLLISSTAMADCSQDLADYQALTDALKKKVELKDKEINILDQRLQNYQKLSDGLADQMGKKETTEGLYRFLYFIAGVTVTAYVAKNVR